MVYQSTSKLIVVFTFCTCLLLSFVPKSNASGWGLTDQLETLQFTLSLLGFETEIVDLDREDGFDKALFINNLGRDSIFIGFPETGMGRDQPMLLAVGGEEIVVREAKEGGLQVLAGNEELIPAGYVEYLRCMTAVYLAIYEAIAFGSCPPHFRKLFKCLVWDIIGIY